jgi:hypothetical protein
MPYNDGNEGDAVARVYKYLERLSSSEMIGAYLRALDRGDWANAAIIAKAGQQRFPFPVRFPDWRPGHDK